MRIEKICHEIHVYTSKELFDKVILLTRKFKLKYLSIKDDDKSNVQTDVDKVIGCLENIV